MDLYVVLAIVGLVVLLAELLLPTGGVLAVLGSIGLIVAGVIALTAESDSSVADIAGPGLITFGAIAIVVSIVIGRKVLSAHRDEPVRTGQEELIGAVAEVRASLDPSGQVWVEGSLWGARLADGESGPLRPGNRVVIEAVEGLTLVVRPHPGAAQETEKGPA